MSNAAPSTEPAPQSGEPAPRPTAWWKKLLLSVMTVVILLGVIEIALRVKYSGTFAKHEDKAYMFMRSKNPELIFEMRPNHTALYPDTDVPLTTNSSGFRDREFTPKPPGRFRIVVIGDSVTVGRAVHADKIYSEVLERRLTKEMGADVDVFNMGVGGYNTLQELEVIKSKAMQHEPDMLVIGYVLNDKVLWGQDAGATRYYLQSGCMLLDQVRLRWGRLKYKVGDDLVTVAFRKLAKFLESHDIPVLIVVFPYLEEDDGEYPYQAEHEHVAALAKEHGYELLDLLSVYREAGLTNLKLRDFDEIHPNELGHKIAGDAIYAYLEARGLNPK